MYLWLSLCTQNLPECTFGGVYVPRIYQDVPLVEFMYPVFTRMYLWWSLCTRIYQDVGHTFGGVYVLCIYQHARWS